MITMNLILSLLIALAFGFEGIMQERYESFINRFSGDVKTDIFVQCSQNFARELQKSLLVNKVSELQREFPFAAKFSESQVLRIPMLNESEEYTVDIPIEIREYRPDKVPINEDIRGFIVNDTYYCNDDNSETSMVTYNYYKLSNYWLVLHTMEIRVTGKGGFTPDFTGATIMLREKKSQKAVILENSYQESLPIIFQCSTGEYILEIYKDRMIYTSGIFIDASDKVLVEIGKRIIIICRLYFCLPVHIFFLCFQRVHSIILIAILLIPCYHKCKAYFLFYHGQKTGHNCRYTVRQVQKRIDSAIESVIKGKSNSQFRKFMLYTTF